MSSSKRGLIRLSAIGWLATFLAGCSISSLDNPFAVTANANGKPTVWDCAMVQMSSPPRYACTDNKTYTAFELRDARLGVVSPNLAAK
jgi:poly-beta-hydroxyalkanoate depolymerase